MPLSRLQVVKEAQETEFRDRLVQGAFIAFQMGAGGKNSFGEYLNSLGLGEKRTESKQAKISTGDILKKSEQVRAKALKLRQKG